MAQRKKYKKPPISELVIGVYFKEPLQAMKAEHIGLFWQKIKKQFPKSSQNLMIGGLDTQVPNEIFPLPRFWFISENETYLIQVQRNALLLNWRKREQAYPHYEELKSLFDENYSIFGEFLAEEFNVLDAPIERCELAYINMIEDQPYFRKFSDVKNVIPSLEVLQVPFDPVAAPDFNLVYSYAIGPELSIALTIQGRRNRNSSKDVLYFELRSTGAPAHGTKAEADILFDQAHEAIGKTFNSLTNGEVQTKYWQPME